MPAAPLRTAAILFTLAALPGCGGPTAVPLELQLQSPVPAERREAATALGRQGASAAASLPALARTAHDDDPTVRQAVLRALAEIGDRDPLVRPTLTAGLSDRELAVRLAAAWGLHRIDPHGRAYVPVLSDAMEAGEGGTIVAVGRLGAEADWAVPVLTRLVLRDHRPGIRRIAIDALGLIGPDDAARKALERARHDPDDRVREAAAAALIHSNGSR